MARRVEEIIERGMFENEGSADAIHAATAILAGASYFVSSDEHHLKKDLKKVEEIEKVIGKA